MGAGAGERSEREIEAGWIISRRWGRGQDGRRRLSVDKYSGREICSRRYICRAQQGCRGPKSAADDSPGF